MRFADSAASHAHSLTTLNLLYEYDDFMASIATMVDLGCGEGRDLEWWATRTTRDEVPVPLNINCVGVDIQDTDPIAVKYPNVKYKKLDFEGTMNMQPGSAYDVMWCHDAFQYALNPTLTLTKWLHLAAEGTMLAITVPRTIEYKHNVENFIQQDNAYYHHTIVSLIHMLAVTGWDCRSGFFHKSDTSPWLQAIVYRSSQEPKDIRTTTMYDLVESKLLPETAEKSIMAHGYLRQHDLTLPWLDHSLTWFGRP
jgi:hypothetical protein